MAKILVYTFFNPRHLTFKILRLIGENNNCIDSDFHRDDTEVSVDKYYLGNLNSLAKHILETKPKYVLGLGDYRKDGKNIRVENIFINKYGRNKIVEGGREKYFATWKLPERNNMVFSQLGSWGPCNRSGYILSKLIEENNLDTKLAFVHIPSSYSEVEAKNIIDEWLMEYTWL